MTTIRERRIINLNSQNATQNNGSFLSNVTFNFSNIYTLEDNVISLSKLQGYYENWSKDWAIKIRKEYV